MNQVEKGRFPTSPKMNPLRNHFVMYLLKLLFHSKFRFGLKIPWIRNTHLIKQIFSQVKIKQTKKLFIPFIPYLMLLFTYTQSNTHTNFFLVSILAHSHNDKCEQASRTQWQPHQRLTNTYSLCALLLLSCCCYGCIWKPTATFKYIHLNARWGET